jgi:hypothetical protein
MLRYVFPDNIQIPVLQAFYKRYSKAVPLHAMVELGGRGDIYISYSFLTSALDGGVSGQRHAPAALCPGTKILDIHCTEGWVGYKRNTLQKCVFWFDENITRITTSVNKEKK